MTQQARKNRLGISGATRAQRLLQHSIEALGDVIPPPPWGPRIEFVFREIGGLIGSKSPLVVLGLRIALSTLATAWRFMSRGDRYR
jgi:hypothetical protein